MKMASVADTALNHHSLTHSLAHQVSIWPSCNIDLAVMVVVLHVMSAVNLPMRLIGEVVVHHMV